MNIFNYILCLKTIVAVKDSIRRIKTLTIHLGARQVPAVGILIPDLSSKI